MWSAADLAAGTTFRCRDSRRGRGLPAQLRPVSTTTWHSIVRLAQQATWRQLGAQSASISASPGAPVRVTYVLAALSKVSETFGPVRSRRAAAARRRRFRIFLRCGTLSPASAATPETPIWRAHDLLAQPSLASWPRLVRAALGVFAPPPRPMPAIHAVVGRTPTVGDRAAITVTLLPLRSGGLHRQPAASRH